PLPGKTGTSRAPDTIGDTARQKTFIGYGFRADRQGWLEYNQALPILKPLAVLFTFATPFCKRGQNPVTACGGQC
ncbi:MAG: hypothetical protein ABSH08_07860, partial [Tepidisphaeraceae bacterium]